MKYFLEYYRRIVNNVREGKHTMTDKADDRNLEEVESDRRRYVVREGACALLVDGQHWISEIGDNRKDTAKH